MNNLHSVFIERWAKELSKTERSTGVLDKKINIAACFLVGTKAHRVNLINDFIVACGFEIFNQFCFY